MDMRGGGRPRDTPPGGRRYISDGYIFMLSKP
jgi:hypothetical protein